ncbi:MAG: SAM hydrolase/SAM-dependent halogenase family protein [Magnetovibrionaceae bacterium]
MTKKAPMIAVFTDFGVTGPYHGQMKAVFAHKAPGVPVIDLMADAPTFDPIAAGYLLARLVDPFPPGTIFLCVVDPGVGGQRRALAVRAGPYWFVGPDNGLFEQVARRFEPAEAFEIGSAVIGDAPISATFHGRDIFAPCAAMLAAGQDLCEGLSALPDADWRRPELPDDLDQVIYIDAFGNAMSGRRANTLGTQARAGVPDREKGRVTYCKRVRTFEEAAPGEAVTLENSCGLLEIAVNQGQADTKFGLFIGFQLMFH